MINRCPYVQLNFRQKHCKTLKYFAYVYALRMNIQIITSESDEIVHLN